MSQDDDGQLLYEQLTPREYEILTLIAEGLSNQEIADRLFIAHSTVKWYARQIFNRMGVNNRRQAVAHARKAGLFAEGEAVYAPASSSQPATPQHNLSRTNDTFYRTRRRTQRPRHVD